MIKSKLKTHINGVFFLDLVRHHDERGWLMELFRSDHLVPGNAPAMGYVSQTEPGVVRGPHEHREQSDLFCFSGPGDFELVLSDKTGYEERHLVGEKNPVMVIVPPGVVHSYRNLSDRPGLVLNFPNRLYGGPGRCYPVDEIRHEEISVNDTFFV